MNERMIQRFHTLGTPRRLKILRTLAAHQGYTVARLGEALNIKQPTLSYHLMHLMHAGLVTPEREGVYAYYHVERAALREMISQLTTILEETQ